MVGLWSADILAQVYYARPYPRWRHVLVFAAVRPGGA